MGKLNFRRPSCGSVTKSLRFPASVAASSWFVASSLEIWLWLWLGVSSLFSRPNPSVAEAVARAINASKSKPIPPDSPLCSDTGVAVSILCLFSADSGPEDRWRFNDGGELESGTGVLSSQGSLLI